MTHERMRPDGAQRRRDNSGEELSAETTPRALLRLQCAAGNRAVAAALAASRRNPAVQREFTGHTADSITTAAELLKSTYKLAKTKQSLPGNQPLGTLDRPRVVEATIDKKSLRSEQRKKDTKLAVVTSLARTEQMLLQGADLKKFYDAGHLVADQLIGGAESSFQYWNLAPQISEFNTPAYSGVEDKIRKSLKNPKDKILISVTLDYPADYTMTTADLIKRGVIPKATYSAPGITVARRIPRLWTLTATRTATTKAPASGAPPTTPTETPTIGKPFEMRVARYVAAAPSTGSKVAPNLRKRQLVATQWTPSSSVTARDAISLLVKTFPDLGDPNALFLKLMPTGHTVVAEVQLQAVKQAAGDVALALLDVQDKLVEARDPTVLEELTNTMGARIRQQLASARDPATGLVDATGHLITAKSWVDDLLEEVTEVIAEQKEKWIFPLSVTHALQEPIRQADERWELSIAQAAPDYEPPAGPRNQNEEEEEMVIDKRTDVRQARDVTGDPGIYRVIEHSGGGSGQLNWLKFGFDHPALYNEAIVINLNGKPTVVVVRSAQRIYGSGIPTGEWLITWKHLGA